jgi:3-oxoacyl-[acyl-carrier-protein] synthase III
MAYINSIGLISPQGVVEDGRFVCVEPVYKDLINPVQLRRMSRILKMGLGASSMCINHLPEAEIDAIIVGTGLACVADLEKFLLSVLDGDEQGLSPIPFINSSHNTVAAQIAMTHKITGYNNTYCHRGASFEAALLDALMLLDEGEAQHVLVGGIDEYLEYNQLIINEDPKMKHVVPGEGAAFFILEKARREQTFAQLKDIHSFLMKDAELNCNDFPLIKTEIASFLQKHSLDMTDIDLFVSGRNGNSISDGIYDELEKDCFPNAKMLNYKHLCGEYMTSTAFALNLTARQLKEQKEKCALIYNHYNYINHSVILLLCDTCGQHNEKRE